MKTPYMCLKCGRMFSTPQEMKSCDHKKEQVVEQPVQQNNEIEDLISRLEELKADDVKKVAKHFDIAYTNKDETVKAIQSKMGLSEDDIKYNQLITKLDELSDEDVLFVSSHLGIEFTNKEETVIKVKEFLGL